MKHTTWVALCAGLVLLTLLLAFSGCSSSLTPETEVQLLILSHSTYVDAHGYFHLVGEVQNIGKCNTEQNTVFVSFFDDDGVVYATGSGPCYRQILVPTEKAPFDIVFLEAPQGNIYRLTADSQATDMEPREGMTFGDVTPSMDADSRYVVTGEIINEESDSIDGAMIVCTCYDASSKVVAVGLSFAEASPIEPTGSSNFTVALDPSISADIDHISLESEIQS